MHNSTGVHVGFGTAALGGQGYDVVMYALQQGFRRFDTAEENDYWYDQKSVGKALADFFVSLNADSSNDKKTDSASCKDADLQISTKIPPWELWNVATIRSNAKKSRQELLGFCDDTEYPLDTYYIHAPDCWKGWHPKCDAIRPGDLLGLRDAWLGMEAVVGLDHSANRIGLSNVHPPQLFDIIQFVQERQQQSSDRGDVAPPRMPDVVQNYADPIEVASEIRKICAQHKIEFVSYSTLGTQHRGNQNPILTSPLLQSIAAKHQRSVAEVVLSWALQNDMSVIPRSRNQHHIQQLASLLPVDSSSPPRTFLDKSDLKSINTLRSDKANIKIDSEEDDYDDDDDIAFEDEDKDHDEEDEEYEMYEADDDLVDHMDDYVDDDYEPGPEFDEEGKDDTKDEL